ncbi:CHAT domain-containing protein [Intrasporangium sp.]|uniref:CHAT domain-containing protein n=1 Tax=Intrasporangium sp. TaxID=1925024 RepID=UPI0033659C7D
MKDLEYDEFEVVLERSGDGYSARVVKSLTGLTPAAPFVPPVEKAALLQLRETMRGVGGTAPAGEVDQVGSPTVTPKAFGSALFLALFTEKALNIFQTSQFVAASHGRGLRLRIRFSDVAELANLPWELLYDPDKHKFLGRHRAYPTIRMLDLPEPVPPFRVTGPLRMLVVISSPKDLPELAVENEWMALQEELKPLVAAGRIDLERLPVPTMEALYTKASTTEFHVFHFIGHGGINANGEGHLAFVRPNGLQHRVPGGDLAVMLEHSPIRLAVLNSCEGGTVSAEDPFGSAAIALVEQGIPAVVAMQFQISDVGARTFSRTLYDSVAAGRSVDLGVTLGRQALLATSETEWATPVLYLRGEDGVLFELEDGPVETILEDPLATRGRLPDTAPVPAPAGEQPPPDPERESEREPETEPVSIAPPPPTGLVGSVREGRVDLRWQQEAAADVSVLDWEVFRDRELISRVVSPRAIDQPEGPGMYSYFVVAAGKGSQKSQPSAEWTATVPGPSIEAPRLTASGPPTRPTAPSRPQPTSGSPDKPEDGWIEVKARHVRRVPVAIVLILALAVAVWLVARPRAAALAAPTHVVAAFDTGLVSMTWDPVPADGPAVDRWEIYLDDVRVTTVRQPEASFPPIRSGQVEYRVVALGADGSRSDPAAVAVTVPRDPAKTADVEISVSEVLAAEGDAVTVTFETDNLGKAELVNEQVFVEAVGGGQLHAVSFTRGSSGQPQPCSVDGAEATCEIGGHAIKGLVHVSATVGWVATSSGVRATVKDTAGTTDPKQKNNAATYKRHLTSPGSPTVTTPGSPTDTSTGPSTGTPTPTVIFSPPEITGTRPPNDG